MIHRALLIGFTAFVFALAPRVRAHPAVEEMAAAATNFLAALDPQQLAKAAFDQKSEERFNWHFIPRERKGLPFREMNPAQTRSCPMQCLGAA